MAGDVLNHSYSFRGRTLSLRHVLAFVRKRAVSSNYSARYGFGAELSREEPGPGLELLARLIHAGGGADAAKRLWGQWWCVRAGQCNRSGIGAGCRWVNQNAWWRTSIVGEPMASLFGDGSWLPRPDLQLIERLGALGLSTPLTYGGGLATEEHAGLRFEGWR